MRPLGKLALTLSVALVLSSQAHAQQRQGRGGPGGFGGGFGGGGAMLIGNKSVQEELKLSEEQVKKADAAASDLRDKQREAGQSLRDLSQEERQQKFREMAEKGAADLKKALADVLTPEQQKRFDQIALQQAGYNAFSRPDIQEKLGLTADQKTKLRDINEQSMARTREIMQDAQGDFAAAREKMTAARKETGDKAMAVLTDAQKETWKELTGKPFEVKFDGPPGGGRRGGPGGGGRRGGNNN
jgi:hypothetical protein